MFFALLLPFAFLQALTGFFSFVLEAFVGPSVAFLLVLLLPFSLSLPFTFDLFLSFETLLIPSSTFFLMVAIRLITPSSVLFIFSLPLFAFVHMCLPLFLPFYFMPLLLRGIAKVGVLFLHTSILPEQTR
ncbi:hypothetical protein A0H81_03930 [Grifola frondosa]|uniref:Uncharacterized protein n=1 Tax=Grifola frondosa TaxID=5627 RepID=A0A1C7MIG8_GRIFR|nr:hypothetical protein A0H81_03930 [Grifola frondosa]